MLIAFIVVAFFAYANRADLFPQWFGKTGKWTQQAANGKPATTAQTPEERKVTRPLPEKTLSKKPVTPPDAAVHGAEENSGKELAPAPVTDELTPPPASEPESDAATNAPAPRAAVTPTEPTPQASPAVVSDEGPAPNGTAETQAEAVADVAANAQQTDTTALAPVPAAAAAAGEQSAVAAVPALPQQEGGPAADLQLEQQLKEARQHYWQHDIRGAESAYRALSETYPQNPDVWGEMGNFYFSLRRREPATEAYSRCIELLITQDKPAPARQLLSVLYRLDALKARELETRLQQAGG